MNDEFTTATIQIFDYSFFTLSGINLFRKEQHKVQNQN